MACTFSHKDLLAISSLSNAFSNGKSLYILLYMCAYSCIKASWNIAFGLTNIAPPMLNAAAFFCFAVSSDIIAMYAPLGNFLSQDNDNLAITACSSAGNSYNSVCDNLALRSSSCGSDEVGFTGLTFFFTTGGSFFFTLSLR